MKKLLYVSLLSVLTPLGIYAADREASHNLGLGRDDWRHELPEEHLRIHVKSEQEIKEALSKLVAQRKSELIDDPETEKLVDEIVKKQLAADARALHTQEKAKQDGEFIALRNAIVNEHSHTLEQAEKEGKYRALVAQAERRNGPGFFQKLFISAQNGLVGAASAIVQEIAISAGTSLYIQATESYKLSQLSPEARIKEEQRQKWDAEAKQSQKEMRYDATYIDLVQSMRDAKTLKKGALDLQKEHQEILKERAAEEEKYRTARAKEKEETLKAAIAIQKAKEESAFKTFKSLHGKADAIHRQDTSIKVFKTLHEDTQAVASRATRAIQKTKQETLINVFKALHNEEEESIASIPTTSTQPKSPAPAA
jgi:hypothetical protein